MEVVTSDPELASEMISLLNKELKAARSRIKELEANATDPEDFALWVERAGEAEKSRDALRASLVDSTAENQLLRAALEDLQDSKGTKQNALGKDHVGRTSKETRDKAIGVTDSEAIPDTNAYVKDLENALESYYARYKAEKSEKKELKSTCKALEDDVVYLKEERKSFDGLKLTLEGEISKLRVENETLQSKLAKEQSSSERTVISGTSKSASSGSTLQIVSRMDIVDYMLQLPNVDKPPRRSALRPIYHSGIGLKQYLSADDRTSSCSGNFLFLPGLVAWCPHVNHAFAVGPVWMYDVAKCRWTRRSIFDALYDKEFSLFYRWGSETFYAGTYKAIKLLHKCSLDGLEDGTIFERGVSLPALADASILGKNSSKNAGRLPPASTVDQLYFDGILKVEPLGLQCVDFDFKLYNGLRARYDELAEGVQYPEDTGPDRPRKKQKTD